MQQRDHMGSALGRATELLTRKVGRSARLEITWSDGCGWLAGWVEPEHRYQRSGSTAVEAVEALTADLLTMPSLRSAS